MHFPVFPVQQGLRVLGKFEKFIHKISKWSEWVGIAAMLLMVAVTCIDVVGAKVFKWRLLGAIDIVMLSQIVAIAFAASMSLIQGRHISVEFFIKLLPKGVQKGIDSFILLLCIVLFGAIIWRLCVLGYSFQTSGEYSATIHIPYYPFAYGIALASIPVCLVLLINLYKMLTKRDQE